jgi:hypothetical protein
MNVNVIMSHVYIARSMELWGTKGPLGPSAQMVGVIHIPIGPPAPSH